MCCSCIICTPNGNSYGYGHSGSHFGWTYGWWYDNSYGNYGHMGGENDYDRQG